MLSAIMVFTAFITTVNCYHYCFNSYLYRYYNRYHYNYHQPLFESLLLSLLSVNIINRHQCHQYQ